MSVDNLRGRLKEGDLLPLLGICMQVACREKLGFSYDEKLAVIRDGYQNFNFRPNLFWFELRTAYFLEMLKQSGNIVDWIPSKKDDTLDRLKTDFVVIRNTSEAIALQSTSTGDHARRRRRSIREIFGKQVVAVVNHRTQNGVLIEPERMKQQLLNAIYSEKLFTSSFY